MKISIEVTDNLAFRRIAATLDDGIHKTVVDHCDLPLNETKKHQIRNVVNEILEFID